MGGVGDGWCAGCVCVCDVWCVMYDGWHVMGGVCVMGGIVMGGV